MKASEGREYKVRSEEARERNIKQNNKLAINVNNNDMERDRPKTIELHPHINI